MPYTAPACKKTWTLAKAKNRSCGFDLCPGFWDWLVREVAQAKCLVYGAWGRNLRPVD